MGAARASPVSAWMAVSRVQDDHLVVPRTALLLLTRVLRQSLSGALPSGSSVTVKITQQAYLSPMVHLLVDQAREDAVHRPLPI